MLTTSAGEYLRSLRRGAIKLDSLAEAGAIRQGVLDGRNIRYEAICRDLKSFACGRMAKSLDENVRGRLVALAERKIDDEFVLRSMVTKQYALGSSSWRELLFLFADEAPNLIGFGYL
jgi:hypothetical protein